MVRNGQDATKYSIRRDYLSHEDVPVDPITVITAQLLGETKTMS